MEADSPELRAKLQELEHELEEGDITQKGYQKRRTVLLSQYINPASLDRSQTGLRVHSAGDTLHPSNDTSRSASLAALNAHSTASSHAGQSYQAPGPDVGRVDTMKGYGTMDSAVSEMTGSGSAGGDSGGYSGRQLAVRNVADQRQSVYDPQPTMTSSFAFNPASQSGYVDQQPAVQSSPDEFQSRQGTMLESHQGYFSDFAGQQRHSYGGGPHRYSASDALSPTAGQAPPMLTSSDLPGAVNHQLPLEPRDLPFAVFDPHNPNMPMSKFDNIASVLRYRGRTNPKTPAYWVLDPRGKEVASITWDKLTSRAEKVAQVIRDKSNLYRGDRVALIYRDAEVIEFAVALMGCFIAGVVAVPINDLDDYPKLNIILTSTQAHLALTTDNNLKNFQRDIVTQKLSWPRGVEWWKTNEFGSFHPKKKEDTPPLIVPDLAYIEFSRAPTGDLRGVVMSHRTLMHQMACLTSIIATVPTNQSTSDTMNSALRDKNGRILAGGGAAEIFLSYLDPRQSIGMILGVLLTAYGGHTTVWIEAKMVETPGLYAHLITKYHATLMVADYPGLKRAAYNYQADPMATRNFKKNFEVNFSKVKLCLIDTLTVDGDFHEILADRWLRPLRNPRAREIVAPMLCLPEHGGMVISMRDWMGGEERMGCTLKLDLDAQRDGLDHKKDQKADGGPNGYTSLIGSGASEPSNQKGRTELSEVLLDREALKTNEVVVVAIGEAVRERAGNEPGTVRIGAFGYPIPDATLAIVDPETSLLCSPYVIGEIWVDSPSLSGGFWALPKHTETIFHARPCRFEEGNPTPMTVEPEFLRTGLLGCVIEGRIFVLGLYEDRLRQKVEWVEHGMEVAEYRYFFVQHLIVTIMKNVPKIYACSAFDVYVNDEHLPIVLLESAEASTNPQSSGGPPRQLDTALLDSLSERCMEVLYQEHHVRVFCVMITAPNTLPRATKNGRREIGNMLCRKEFDNGSLPCVHVKFGVERAVLNLPVGPDPDGGIWSAASTAVRQEILEGQEKQYSGVDHREVVIDDRTSTPLNIFPSIVDLLQWRVARQTDELSYCTIDGRGKEGKGITWRKLDTKIAAVAMYLKNKAKVRPGDHLILMYTHSEDFVVAVHACFCLGAVAIPIAPLDQMRLNEDVPAFLTMVADFGVKAVLVNNDVDHLLKQKIVSQHIKQSASVSKLMVPNTYNTAKAPKQTTGCRDLGLTTQKAWVEPTYPVLIWTYWTPDQRRQSVQMGHDTIMGTCKVQKETCQMTSSRPVLGCVRSTNGLGFVHTCLMGVFVGAPTYLVSPVDFAANPVSLFLTLSRYKIKDTYATSQMLDHAMNTMPGKGFTLHELKNMMISTEGRPRVDVFQKVRLHFAATGLDRTAINTIYSHVLNPMIASRSYMCIEPIELCQPTSLLVQDSGMVPVSTQIAIVNPESNRLCHVGEFGEIWVQSEACVRAFYGSKDGFDTERFNGRTVDGDSHVRYVRTGDLGFLHNVSRPIGPGGAQIEMQILFVLGSIGETFEVNGLSHFPMDIEYSVEKCHRNIVPGGCAVFQAGGMVVILVEVVRKAYLASVVPVIVNAVLSEHQLVVDIVAFVSKGDFPRSRLGDKQRGKILASWVTRKMRTIAQFGIRDASIGDSQITEVAEPRSRIGSIIEPHHGASSLRHAESIDEARLSGVRNAESINEVPADEPVREYMSYPAGISEMPTHYNDSIGGSSRVGGSSQNTRSDDTPTEARHNHFELEDNNAFDEDAPPPPVNRSSKPDGMAYQALPGFSGYDTYDETIEDNLTPPPLKAHHSPSAMALPSVTGRESLMEGDLRSLPSQQQQQARGGGLRAVNASAAEDSDDEWPQEAIMHMNLAGGDSSRPPQQQPRSPSFPADGYGHAM
ncbi:MAG: hypothetical protein M1832_001096 [Thelocarpon impressellum]|nr:MAG: hypothetical protein M1832_001096 [Thelocarpon impressellum]